MTDTMKVFATDDRHVGIIKHPMGPPLTKDGVLWPYDGFTCGLLVDGTIERVLEAEDAYREPPKSVAPLPKLAPVPSPS